MSATDAVARMLTLVPWLLERPGASVDETAEAFGVTQSVLRRDLAALEFCGLPGLRGGDLFEVDIVADRIVVRMADELRRPLRLTPREALRLVLTVDAVAEALGEEVPALASAVDKVRRAAGIPPGVAVHLEHDGAERLPVLRDAIARRVAVVLSYAARGEDAPTDRVVDPWSLEVVDGSWYLHGQAREAEGHRTYRLDRIADVRVTEQPVAVEAPRTALPAPRYQPGPQDVEVVLEVAPRGRWVLDAVRAEEVAEHPDGSATVRLHTDTPAWLVGVVLTAAGSVVLTAPTWLAQRVREAALAALARYEGAFVD
ncbi:MAG: helix-turn-helix transcriptional regulator [Actinomycetes bacterium]